MRVIFLEDVPKVARAGEIKEVADGYGRNFLIPRKLALLASPESINAVGVKLKGQARREAQTEAEMVEVANQLDGKEISLEALSGSKDRLYGSITTADIADELEKAFGVAVDKRKIEIAEPIHELGSYEVEIRLAKDIAPKITVTVTGESTPKKSRRSKKEAG